MLVEIFHTDLSSTVVIGSALSVIVVIISYVVYKIGIGEKSFEEVIEEQKRRSIEEELKQKSEKVKKEKRFKKTWGKKSKEKVEPEIIPESTPVNGTKDVATNIEIIEPKEMKPMKQKNKPKSASNQQADTAAQERNKKAEASPVIDKPVQEKKKNTVEVEKIKIEQKVAESTKFVESKESIQSSMTITQSASQPAAAVQKKKKMVENVKPIENKEIAQSPPIVSLQSANQPTATVPKKKKKEHVEKDATPLTADKILLMIKESELEAEEIQNLIDVLLNKQKDSSGWTKKNDPLALTKKNLHEKEQLLDQEQRQNQAVTSKLKDLREEYNSVKSKFSAQEKANLEKIARQQQDIQALTAKVKQVQEQLVVEKEKSAQNDKENEKKLQASIKSLEEEKAKLLQKISKLETESRSGISKSDYEAVKKAREDMQKVHALLVEQHTQLVLKEKSELAQLSDSKAQVDKLSAENKVLSNDYKALMDLKTAAEVAKKTIEDKLKVEEKRSADLDAQIKQLTAQTAEIAHLQAELKELKLENERLTDQLVTTKERVAGDGQEIVHQNGELNGRGQEISDKLLDEKEKLLEEKESLLIQLNEDLNKQKAKIAVLSEEIEIQKQKNNELREKNWKAMEALTNAEKNAEQQIKEVQIAADQKIAHLEKDIGVKQVASTNSESSPELTLKLKQAESEAAQRLSDYNKEVEKNRHLSSEINKLNELNNCRIAEAQKNVEELKSDLAKSQSRTKECLQRICPSVSIDSSLPFDKWVLEFEKQASIVITSVSQSVEPSVNIEELLEQKEEEYLQKQRHCEQVLAETESTLLELQKRAESQEGVWQERLKSKELELEQIKSERDALAAEKENMQSTFQQISQLEELQDKLKLLQSTLESAESERSHFEQKYDEVHKNCLNLRDQLENKENEISELRKESNSLERLNKEIEDLKSRLDKEKKISKDFSSQMIRLNSLVKIGQDALTAEQEMVKKLKQQLEASQVSTANGSASATKASPVTVIESQPKTKSEKSKKKMDASDKK